MKNEKKIISQSTKSTSLQVEIFNINSLIVLYHKYDITIYAEQKS